MQCKLNSGMTDVIQDGGMKREKGGDFKRECSTTQFSCGETSTAFIKSISPCTFSTLSGGEGRSFLKGHRLYFLRISHSTQHKAVRKTIKYWVREFGFWFPALLIATMCPWKTPYLISHVLILSFAKQGC